MNIVTQILLPLILAFIMFSMGLSLVVDDFKRVAKFPKAFTIGFILQVFSLPLLGFAIAYIWTTYFGLNPLYATGIVIIAACPGGVTSNLMTHLGRGDTALSISLTAIISVITVATLPFIVNLGLSTFNGATSDVQLNVVTTVLGVFVITTVPVLIGMFVKSKWSDWADRFEPIARQVATVFFVLIILAAILKDWKTLVDTFGIIGPATLTLNLVTLGMAFGISKLLSLTDSQARAITFECGLQNGTLAIFVSLTLLGSKEMVLPGAIYSILMFITGGFYLMYLMRKTDK